MRIKIECIGQQFSAISPVNGLSIRGVIVDDPAEFKLYKVLGLDVFDNTPKTLAKVIEVKPVKQSGRTSKK